MKDDEMGEACGVHEREERYMQSIGGKILVKGTTWKAQALMGGCENGC